MLYDEFVAGTGCRESDYNYQIYKELEIIYMNTDCTKEHIYEMGKKLVDNSKTEAEIEFENKINAEIADLKNQLEDFKKELDRCTGFYKENKKDAFWKKEVDWYKQMVKQTRNKIQALRWILN
jgi:hypothetical protein